MKTLIIFLKYPEPGKVKTRLGATIGLELAAEFYRLFVQRTIAIAQQSSFERRVLYFEPAARQADFARMAPVDFELLPQPDLDLGGRLKHAFKTAFATGTTNAIAIGTDSPTLPLSYLDAAVTELSNYDVLLGPAGDGGYYLIGLKSMQETLFQDIQWSSDKVFSATVTRAEAAGLKHFSLPTWYDVDDLATLKQAMDDDTTGEIKALLQKHQQKIAK